MNSESRPVPIDELLADAGWVRGLAGTLVRDDPTADDVTQEALAAALQSPPADDRPARAWLTTVIRNFARKSHRSGTRRRAREEAVARPERDELPGPDELAERLETQRLVARLVAGLDEPYRSTVLLRFYEGLSSAEIARRQGVPAGTVRWRLKTALDTLRERLDTHHDGDRKTWIALLLPIAPPQPADGPIGAGAGAAAIAGLGGALVVKKLMVAAVVLVMALVGLQLGGVFDPPAPDPVPVAEGPAPAVPPVSTEAPTSVPKTGRASTALPLARESSAVVHLRLVDENDEAVPNAIFTMSGPTEPVPGDARGRVRLVYPLASEAESMSIGIRAAGFADKTLRIGVRREEETDLGVIRLERAGTIVGLVTGPDGRPVPNARVRLTKTRGMIDLDASDRVSGPVGVRARGTADDRGRFRVEGIPFGSWRVWAGAEDMRWSVSDAVLLAKNAAPPKVALTLEPLAPDEQFAGLVLDPEGKPVPGARVSFRLVDANGKFIQSSTFEADDRGRFRFTNRGAARGTFRARDAGDRFGEARIDDYVPGSGEIVLRLPTATRMSVRAVSPDGEPVEEFGVTLRARDGGESLGGRTGRDGQATLIAPSLPFTVRVESDGCRDEIRGPFTAGDVPAELVITLTPLPGIRGRVLADGRPLAGARVVVHALAGTRWHSEFNGFTVTLDHPPRAIAVTEADGTFRLAPKRAGRMLVRAETNGRAPAESAPFDYDPARGIDDLEIAVGDGGTLTGRVLTRPGEDPTGTIVGISRGDTYGRTVRVGADGAYRFEHLTPGPWQVVIRKKEILPGAASSFGGGRFRPIPFNCRVAEGETTVFDLPPPPRPAVLIGRLLVNGKPPVGWRASLYRAGGGLASLTEKDLDAEGRFRLRTVEGDYRVILTSPGRLFTSTMVVVDLAVVGETRRDLAYSTGALEDAPASPKAMQYLHRFRSQGGWLVLTPLPTETAPIGEGDIVRFDVSRWSRPSEWPVIRSVRVK